MRRPLAALVGVLFLAAPVVAVGCGELFGQVAEQRHIARATAAYVYDGDPAATWSAAVRVLAEAGYELPPTLPVAGAKISAPGPRSDIMRSRVDVTLLESGAGHQLELRRIEERQVEDVTWEDEGIARDDERIVGLTKRMGRAARKQGDWVVFDDPLYRVWAEARQELVDAGIDMPPGEAVPGRRAATWVAAGEGRSRRVVQLEKRGEDATAVRIDVERQKKHVETRWETSVDERDARLQLAVIEAIAPADAAAIRNEANAKKQRARNVGEKFDDAAVDAIEEAAKQENP